MLLSYNINKNMKGILQRTFYKVCFNGKSLEGYVARAELPKLNDFIDVGKKIFGVRLYKHHFNYYNSHETFKTDNTLTFNSKKVL